MIEGAIVSLPKNGEPLPMLIDRAGERAAWRFIEFFTVNIRNPNTRAAYGRAVGAFLHWCEEHGIPELRRVQPVHVAAYVEQISREGTVCITNMVSVARALSAENGFNVNCRACRIGEWAGVIAGYQGVF